jgi:hypothetical protein
VSVQLHVAQLPGNGAPRDATKSSTIGPPCNDELDGLLHNNIVGSESETVFVALLSISH